MNPRRRIRLMNENHHEYTVQEGSIELQILRLCYYYKYFMTLICVASYPDYWLFDMMW